MAIKKFILFYLLLITYWHINGQDYACIRNKGSFYYSNDTTIYAVRIDSMYNEGNDIVMFNYNQVHIGTDGMCFTYKENSWIVRRIIEKPDGRFLFVTTKYDTLSILSKASLNETWMFQRFVSATVKKIDTIKILGVVDSAKTILLKSDKFSWINNRKIILSKHFGLYSLFDFSEFPQTSSVDYMLIDSDMQSAGEIPTNAYDFFNMDAGDEFHTSYFEYDFGNSPRSNLLNATRFAK